MRVHSFVPAAAIAALLSTGSSLARAEGPAPAAPAAASDGGAMDIFGVSRFFVAPLSLGDAWERAVHAVLDRMRSFLEAERAAALAAAAPPKKRVTAWSAPPPRAQEVGSMRRIVQLHPVKIEPVTVSVADARGQSAVLLGGSLELPWMVP